MFDQGTYLAYFQLERATSYTDANRFVVLDGRTEIKGFEASLSGELTPQLSLFASAMALDPVLKKAALKSNYIDGWFGLLDEWAATPELAELALTDANSDTIASASESS